MTVLIAVTLMGLLSLVCGYLLQCVGRFFPPQTNTLVSEIEALLPQTQCAQCGYPGCKPYATAIAEQAAAINLCPPGGQDTINALASLLGQQSMPLDVSLPPTQIAQIARIDESQCIGCTLCIAACPVDAIVGAAQLMHTVVPTLCTGCDLCIAPCPVDCIQLKPTTDNQS